MYVQTSPFPLQTFYLPFVRLFFSSLIFPCFYFILSMVLRGSKEKPIESNFSIRSSVNVLFLLASDTCCNADADADADDADDAPPPPFIFILYCRRWNFTHTARDGFSDHDDGTLQCPYFLPNSLSCTNLSSHPAL